MKKLRILLTFLLLFYPNIVFAYSSKIVVGGENIGINIHSKGILVVGFYKVNGKSIEANPAIEIGDSIVKVGNVEVNSINELTSEIERQIKENHVVLTLVRDGKEFQSDMTLIEEDHVFKTGLYVKDSITGIGTLTYIDPETHIFGALGHEIIEANSNKRIEVKTGTIFNSVITGINKSSNGSPGEKKATFKPNDVYGTISKNTSYGLFGEYTTNFDTMNTYEVATKEEVKVGDAVIRTVLNGSEVKEYKIYIHKINEYNKMKNISFEITDPELIDKAGGVVQGMSGSPILQNNKIIGAVTHVIIDDVKSGYGIFITTMLEEGES